MLNQWYFLKYKDEPYDFVNRIFDKAPNNNIIVHTLLIETIEKNTTGTKHDYYDDNFANYVYDLIRDENGMNSKHFTIEQKARIFVISQTLNIRCVRSIDSISRQTYGTLCLGLA